MKIPFSFFCARLSFESINKWPIHCCSCGLRQMTWHYQTQRSTFNGTVVVVCSLVCILFCPSLPQSKLKWHREPKSVFDWFHQCSLLSSTCSFAFPFGSPLNRFWSCVCFVVIVVVCVQIVWTCDARREQHEKKKSDIVHVLCMSIETVYWCNVLYDYF